MVDNSFVDTKEYIIAEPELETPLQTPIQTPTTRGMDSSGEESVDLSSGPHRYRVVEDLYNETKVINMLDKLMLSKVEEPVAYVDAAGKQEWRETMNLEFETIEKNNTWTLTDLPAGHKAIGVKWVYKLKRDTDGKVVKHKARIVVKGYVQRKGIDYDEVFAPVVRLETICLLLALSAKENWTVHHLDVKSAFLNGELNEEVYVTQPEGFLKKGQEHKVYKLKKTLYGLRQAPRAWNAKLDECLRGLGFKKCLHEQDVYTKCKKGNMLIVGVYVDELLVAGSSECEIKGFKE